MSDKVYQLRKLIIGETALGHITIMEEKPDPNDPEKRILGDPLLLIVDERYYDAKAMILEIYADPSTQGQQPSKEAFDQAVERTAEV